MKASQKKFPLIFLLMRVFLRNIKFCINLSDDPKDNVKYKSKERKTESYFLILHRLAFGEALNWEVGASSVETECRYHCWA